MLHNHIMRLLVLIGIYYTVTATYGVREKRETDCPGDGQFLCPDGRCIDEIHVCDGFDDCWDEMFIPPEMRTNISSDENIALCLNKRCPRFAFQCAYGGCIETNKKCNGVFDCNDGSDENEELCRRTVDVNDGDVFVDGRCKVIKSENFILKCTIAGYTVRCDEPAVNGTRMVVTCKYGYHKLHYNSISIETVCLDSGNWSPPLHDDCTVCGGRYAIGNYGTLISNAQVTKFLEYPWQAGLYEELPTKVNFLCGGSIIHPRAILTAAHCVFDDNIDNIAQKTFKIAVGKYNSSWNYEHPLEQRFEVKNISITKYYHGLSNRHDQDIAILELNKDIIFNSVVTAVCIDWNNELQPHINSSSFGTVVGWGKTEVGEISDLLRVAKLKYYDFQDCKKFLPKTFLQFITSDKICAGLGNDTMVQEGDSGGGLTFPLVTADGTELHHIYGIVSIKNKKINDVAAFTKVKFYLGWIKEILENIINDTKDKNT